jgi:hypothetical protein
VSERGYGAYENVDVFAECAVGMRFYDFFDGAAGVESLWHCGVGFGGARFADEGRWRFGIVWGVDVFG